MASHKLRPAPRFRRAPRKRHHALAPSRYLLMQPAVSHQGTRSLALDSVILSLYPPHVASLLFYSTGHRLNAWWIRDEALHAQCIFSGNVLIYDEERTVPEDGELVLVADGRD